jgi:hypothetical protein
MEGDPVMPTMKGNSSIAASTTTLTLLTGQDYEFLPADAMVSLWASQSATGLSVTLKGNAESLLSSAPPNIASAAGIVSLQQDGLVSQEMLPKGTKLQLGGVNTTGGALTLNWIVDVTFL